MEKNYRQIWVYIMQKNNKVKNYESYAITFKEIKNIIITSMLRIYMHMIENHGIINWE